MGLMDIIRRIPRKLRKEALLRMDTSAPERDPHEAVGQCRICGEEVLYKDDAGNGAPDETRHERCDRTVRNLKIGEIRTLHACKRTADILRDVPGMRAPMRSLVSDLPEEPSARDLFLFIHGAERALRENERISDPLRFRLLEAMKEIRKSLLFAL